MTASSGKLRVAGATLHFTVRGAGPVLLFIHGSIADSGVYGPLAGLLADRFTVVTYDRRGYLRSPLDAAPAPMVMAEQSEDASRILDEVGAQRACVFGSSGGALIGLDLLAAHPDRVAGLVAHEPPVLSLLPEQAELLSFIAGLTESADRDGAPAAAEALLARLLPAQEEPEFEPGFDWDPDFAARMADNSAYWFSHEVGPGFAYRPDLAALAGCADRLLLGVGAISAAWPAARAAAALGEAVGSQTVVFPGGHTGYLTRPRAFHDKLVEVLAGAGWTEY